VRFVFTPPADHAARLLTLPWSQPLTEWRDERLVEIRQRGISRHVVRFVYDDGTLYALNDLASYCTSCGGWRVWGLVGRSGRCGAGGFSIAGESDILPWGAEAPGFAVGVAAA
jgi:hypothetical protein